ncbi:hypothetical protein [Pseudonocardia sp. WMMC193]|uniref:hypothetical protein n=1 Tax=Pseudonocardia sp. WMMC193 TaxID=2911965 RepID=UPI001F26636B|nr:hypothetical protein [Pseudonocardia sp. WMMC193]MCF7552588.1 hypothetical protein [Pseudonocardia sp. WMMC193]
MPEPLDLHQAAAILRGHGGLSTTADHRKRAAARILYELDDEFRCRVWSRKLLDALDSGQADDVARARRGLERVLDR